MNLKVKSLGNFFWIIEKKHYSNKDIIDKGIPSQQKESVTVKRST